MQLLSQNSDEALLEYSEKYRMEMVDRQQSRNIESTFSGVKFCPQCTITIGSCHAGKGALGTIFLEKIKEYTGCKVQGFDSYTTPVDRPPFFVESYPKWEKPGWLQCLFFNCSEDTLIASGEPIISPNVSK